MSKFSSVFIPKILIVSSMGSDPVVGDRGAPSHAFPTWEDPSSVCSGHDKER